ncbi:hypothetical protein [Halobellus ruber]|uniref:Uncharacterized protein n=1 Tax=Halobellus ruber TaxID=2761102 RepID=A0A7J9SJ33_9EURY|nr:hypothetical protein [Halobellus ruber]MBB6646960.1 hypothetical protein [Halobellus ruber]
MDRSGTLIILAAAGGLLALGAGAALPGSVSPTYNVAVDDTGPPEWEDLSPEAKTVVRTGLEAPGAVNVTFAESGSYGNGTTEFGLYPDDLPRPDIDQSEPSRMVIDRDGAVLVFSAEFVGGGTLAISAVDRTDTVLLRRGNLSPHGRTVLDVAAANGSAAFYTDRPPALEDGLDATPDSLLALVVSDADLFVLADGDDYRTVVVSSPSNWIPLGPVLTPAVVLGSLATVPAVALFGSRRVGWPLATAAGVAAAVLPVVAFRIVAVGPSALLGRRLQEMAHLVVVPAIGALLCVGVVRGWQTANDRPRAEDEGE